MTIGSKINLSGLDDLLASSGFNYVSFNHLFAAAHDSLNAGHAPSAQTVVKLDRTTRRILEASAGLAVLSEMFGARFNRDDMLESWRIKTNQRFRRLPWSTYDLVVQITIKTPVEY